MTKAEEYRALKMIRNILADCGKDSYIAAAFSGCCELAEENINGDFLFSYPERLEYVRRTCGEENERMKSAWSIAQMDADSYRVMAEELEQKVVKLKARLYDMMVGE